MINESIQNRVNTLLRMLVNILSWGYFEKFRRARHMRSMYLDLMQRCLTGVVYEDMPFPVLGQDHYDPKLREYGWDWPTKAHTMIGVKRLANVRFLTEQIIKNRIVGDFMETGVWRGGACIMMRAVMAAYAVEDRRVWLADSFAGLPAPSPELYPEDADEKFHEYKELSVSVEEVRSNFEKYNLLDDQVVFLKGWFKDTLPSAPIEKLALLRLDGDLYESTIIPLEALYDKVSSGGYIIVDDYHVVNGCKKAVHDFRASRNINLETIEIDGVGIYWQKV
jgi:O-methyltransferase